MKIALFTGFAVLLFVSACTNAPSGIDSTSPGTGLLPACGNGVMELGEQCDQSACTGGALCTADCTCESLTPPALPEE